MNGKLWPVLVVGGLALAAALYVGLTGARWAESKAAVEPVVVAARPIPAYALISADMLATELLPRGLVGAAVYTAPDQLVGRLASVDIPPGAVVFEAYAAPPAQVRMTGDPEAVVLSLPVAAEQAVYGQLRAGQRVDVWAADRRGSTFLVGQDLRVLAVDERSEEDTVVVLALPQTSVEPLLAAVQPGRIWLALAPLTRQPTATATAAATATATATVTAVPTATPNPSPTVGEAVVKPGPAGGLNVRAGPGLTYPVLDVVRAGVRLQPVARNAAETWLQVCCVDANRDGQAVEQGWVRADLVDTRALVISELPAVGTPTP